MGDIQVVDNFLSTEELNKVLHKSENFHWRYGHSSTGNGIKFWNCDLKDDEFFSTHIFKKIEKCFKKKFIINRVYANGQTYGLDGAYHIDDDDIDTYTFLLYISNITKENVKSFDGYTLFKKDDRIVCVEPIFNRCVLFKSNILHKGMAPSRNTNMLRISIAFKLKEIK